MDTIARARNAQRALYRQGVISSPLLRVEDPSSAGPREIYLKLENLQPVVRCYKIRGAFNSKSSPAR